MPILSRRPYVVAALAFAGWLTWTTDAHAYVGPGAGFAFLSSFFVLLTTILIVLASLLVWPFRAMWRMATARATAKTKVGRLIIVGFDGQDPGLTDRYLAEGLLPNFKKLAESGAYQRLRTTFPSVSPVAWSSFSTGCEPGRHNIFDFIEPDRRTYLPRLSSVHVGAVDRFFELGSYRWPRNKPDVRLLRKSRPFWSILGDHRVWSTVLRVPVTFPPDRFYGAQLSAMCVPDLLGTQGTFLLLSTRSGGEAFTEGGQRVLLPSGRDEFEVSIPGPDNTFRRGAPPMTTALRLSVDRARGTMRATTNGQSIDLAKGQLSGWVRLRFHAAPGVNVHGLTRMMLTELGDHVSVYMCPINIDPERPAMPISHPAYYATYLAKRIGPYATLGLAEDTWARNEGVTDDETFLHETYDIDREREDMLFATLDRQRRGVVACVFDGTDRIQHMFWRHLGSSRDAVRDLYKHNDGLVGRIVSRLHPDDVLMVISDHGFTAFRRGFNLNAWLHREGYLVLKPGADGRREWLVDVDWSATRAYCLGLTGMFLNVHGRERDGIVQPGRDAATLRAEIASKLRGLRDPDKDEVAIRDVFETATIYSGPYAGNAPDLLIGYNAGYRISWEGAKGVVAGPVFQDNAKAWSGDHCVDPRLVPGVYFSNRPLQTENPALIDIAPTALKLFGIEPPAYMDGRALEGLA